MEIVSRNGVSVTTPVVTIAYDADGRVISPVDMWEVRPRTVARLRFVSFISRSGSRMTEPRSDAYGYNDRNELTNALKNATLNEYAYLYDDIGNRLTSLG